MWTHGGRSQHTDHRITQSSHCLAKSNSLRTIVFKRIPHQVIPTPRLCCRPPPGPPTGLIRSVLVGTDGTWPFSAAGRGRVHGWWLSWQSAGGTSAVYTALLTITQCLFSLAGRAAA